MNGKQLPKLDYALGMINTISRTLQDIEFVNEENQILLENKLVEFLLADYNDKPLLIND